MPSSMVIFSLMSDSKWPPGSDLDCAIFMFWAVSPKLMTIQCLFMLIIRVFFGTQGSMLIFSLMSDSKWMPGGHLDLEILTFRAIIPKLLMTWCLFMHRIEGFGVCLVQW